MRRKKDPTYLHHAGTGQARIIDNGKSIYLGKFGSPESEAEYKRQVLRIRAEREKAERKAIADRERAERLACVDLTVAELVEQYTAHAKTYYRKNGRQTSEFGNICAALRPLREKYPHGLAKDFGPRMLKEVRQDWIAAGMIRKSINRRVERVRAAFGWAVGEELLDVSVVNSLKTVKGLQAGRSEAREGRKVLPVSDDLVDAVKPHVSRQVWALIELQRASGMRPGEAVSIRGCDLETTADVWTYRPSEHKTEHHESERVIFLGPIAQSILRPWLRPEPEAFLFQPVEAMAEFRASQRARRKTKVQPSQLARKPKRNPERAAGSRYTSASYSRAIRTGCIKAGVSHWHPHQLRHAAGTKIRASFGLEGAQVALGHKHVRVTETYAERDQSLGRRVAEQLG